MIRVKRVTRANRFCHTLSKERKEQFAPIALFKRATRAKERIPNSAQPPKHGPPSQRMFVIGISFGIASIGGF